MHMLSTILKSCCLRPAGFARLRAKYFALVPLVCGPFMFSPASVPLVPAPLYPTSSILVGPGEARSFWVTLRVPAAAAATMRELTVSFPLGNGQQKPALSVPLEISKFVIQTRHDFPVIHWWRGEATW